MDGIKDLWLQEQMPLSDDELEHPQYALHGKWFSYTFLGRRFKSRDIPVWRRQIGVKRKTGMLQGIFEISNNISNVEVFEEFSAVSPITLIKCFLYLDLAAIN